MAKDAITRKYIGGGDYVPGVPARDLTEEEWSEHVDAGRIVTGEPSAKLWKKVKPGGES